MAPEVARADTSRDRNYSRSGKSSREEDKERDTSKRRRSEREDRKVRGTEEEDRHRSRDKGRDRDGKHREDRERSSRRRAHEPDGDRSGRSADKHASTSKREDRHERDKDRGRERDRDRDRAREKCRPVGKDRPGSRGLESGSRKDKESERERDRDRDRERHHERERDRDHRDERRRSSSKGRSRSRGVSRGRDDLDGGGCSAGASHGRSWGPDGPTLTEEEKVVFERKRKVEAWQAQKRAEEKADEKAEQDAEAAAADGKGWTLEDDESDEDEDAAQARIMFIATCNYDHLLPFKGQFEALFCQRPLAVLLLHSVASERKNTWMCANVLNRRVLQAGGAMDADDGEPDPLDAFMEDVGTAVKHDLEAVDPAVAQDALDVNPALAKSGVKLDVKAGDEAAAVATKADVDEGKMDTGAPGQMNSGQMKEGWRPP
jgi:hypothetical protein